MMFERVAREIHAIAMHRKYSHVQAVFLAKENEFRPVVKKTPPTSAVSPEREKKVKKFGMQIESGFMNKKDKKDKKDKKGDRERSSSPDKGNKGDKGNESYSVEDADSDAEEEPQSIIVEKIDKRVYFNSETKECSFVESSFFSLWNASLHDTEFFRGALRCYAGLATSLLRRADKISLAVRSVEKKHKLKHSMLNLCQRLGDDFADLCGHLLETDGPPPLVNAKQETGDIYATFLSSLSYGLDDILIIVHHCFAMLFLCFLCFSMYLMLFVSLFSMSLTSSYVF